MESETSEEITALFDDLREIETVPLLQYFFVNI